MLITRFNAHDNWYDIFEDLIKKFPQICSINPFMVDKTILKFEDGRILSNSESLENGEG